jgi:Domain of unknown function (DUF1918)
VSVKIGDHVTVEAERTSQTPRHGVIEEILREAPPCFRVHWDDGHESILSPAAGSVRVEPKRRATASGKRAASTKKT